MIGGLLLSVRNYNQQMTLSIVATNLSLLDHGNNG